MRISLQVVVDTEGDMPATVTEIARFERDDLDASSLGLHLAEAKSLLSRLQRTMIEAQVAEAIAWTSVCPACGAQLACKGHIPLDIRADVERQSQIVFMPPQLYQLRELIPALPVGCWGSTTRACIIFG